MRTASPVSLYLTAAWAGNEYQSNIIDTDQMRQFKINPSVTVRNQTVNQYLTDILRYPMVSPDEETSLAMRIQDGDEEAFNRLVESNLRFVVSVAK